MRCAGSTGRRHRSWRSGGLLARGYFSRQDLSVASEWGSGLLYLLLAGGGYGWAIRYRRDGGVLIGISRSDASCREHGVGVGGGVADCWEAGGGGGVAFGGGREGRRE